MEELKKKYPSESEELSSAAEELESRLLYLRRIGLGYLSSKRLSNTLSGGELQRIKMSRCLGNYLTQTLFCLDEPSSGLHPRDTEKLIEVIKEIGAPDPEEGGITTVKFGPLFYKYADISDTLVGILMRAKKRKRIKYQGDMLFQNMHDHVKITVLQ